MYENFNTATKITKKKKTIEKILTNSVAVEKI